MLTILIRCYVHRWGLGAISFYGKGKYPYGVKGKLFKFVDFIEPDFGWNYDLCKWSERFFSPSKKHFVTSQNAVYGSRGHWMPFDS